MSQFLVSVASLAALWRVWSIAALVLLGSVAVTHGQAVRMSRVDATVTLQPDGRVLYEFTVNNTTTNPCGGEGPGCDLIVNWELPIFSMTDVDVGSITAPSGWDFEIIPPDASTSFYNNPEGPFGQYSWGWDPALDPTLLADPLAYGPNPDVFRSPPLLIHWFTTAPEGPDDPIFEGDFRTGFSFLSAYGDMPAPYQASWFRNLPTTGDPPIPGQPGFGTPNSPERQAAQPTTLLVLKEGRLRLHPDPNEDKLSLVGSFMASPGSIDPPAEGASVSLSDGDGVIVTITIPPGEGWTSRPGPEWSFKDKKDKSLGDPVAREKLRIKFNADTGQFDLHVKVKKTELMDPDAGFITTRLTIGDQTFANTQMWQSKAKGKRLVTP